MTQDLSAYQRLRQLILTGDLRPDERLGEVAWAKRLGLGRAAIRAALMRLAGEGLVVKVRASYRAPSLRSEDVREFRQMREILEVGALRVAAPISEAMLDEIRKACGDYRHMVEKGYFAGAREADLRFHHALVGAAGNKRLLGIYQAANLPLFQNRIGTEGIMLNDYAQALAEHQAIVEALDKRKVDEALRVLTEHLRRGEIEVNNFVVEKA